MTAEQAKEYGIIDEIIESRAAAEELVALADAR
jgi:ATP-dependent protease ClpP protease subunit